MWARWLGRLARRSRRAAATTTASSLPLLEEGPPQGSTPGGAEGEDSETAQDPPESTTTSTTAAPHDTDETGRQVTAVVAGLLAVAFIFAVITAWYWRRTRPAGKRSSKREE